MSEPLNDNYLELLKRGSVLEQMAAIEIDSLRNSHAALVAVCNEAADALSEGLNPIEMDGLVAKLRAAARAGRDGK